MTGSIKDTMNVTISTATADKKMDRYFFNITSGLLLFICYLSCCVFFHKYIGAVTQLHLP